MAEEGVGARKGMGGGGGGGELGRGSGKGARQLGGAKRT